MTQHEERKVGDCTLVKLIGEGRMGQVWHGKHTTRNVDVAVKVIFRSYYSNEQFLEKVENVAQQTSKLYHHNIVRILDYGFENDLHYIATQFVDGTTISKLASENKLDIKSMVNYILQTLTGLEYAHKKGIIHRGIKLGNLMLTSDETVKITDFGLTREYCQQNSKEKTTYMSPEHLNDINSVAPQSDIYSTGIALFEMLLRQHPIQM